MVWVKGGRRKNLELGALFNLELGKMNLELGIKIVFAISLSFIRLIPRFFIRKFPEAGQGIRGKRCRG
jgi:hypothetical protein